MKLFDKIKDLFTDEIIEDNENIVEIKEEKRMPSIITKEKKEEKNEIDLKSLTEKDLFKDFSNLEVDNVNKIEEFNNNNINNNFRFPIAFEEDELLDEKILGNQNVMQREKQKEVIPEKNELYSASKKKEEKVSLFKVSPVISPVYGILDKNYKKEEVQPRPIKTKDMTRNSSKVDFESVRKKAYGSLIDDIKENLSPAKKEEVKEEKKFEDFYILEDDINEITFGDVENNFEDFGVTIDDYKKEKKDNIEIINFSDKEPIVEKIEINQSIINSKKQEDDFEDKNEEDIFNLIDNMYQEKEDDIDDRC